MSQINLPDLVNPYSGALNAAFINAIKAALLSGNSMAQRPDLAQAGMAWSKNVSATERQLLFYDGTVDHLLISVNPSTGDVLGINTFIANLIYDGLGTKLDTSAFTAAQILTMLKTVHGTGSGLDADFLDGIGASEFATAAQGIKADNALLEAKAYVDDNLAVWEPWDGGSDAIIYDNSVDGNVSVVETGTLLTGYHYRTKVKELYNSFGDFRILYLEGFKGSDLTWLRLFPSALSNTGGVQGFNNTILEDPANTNTDYLYSTHHKHTSVAGAEVLSTNSLLTVSFNRFAINQGITKLRWITSLGDISNGTISLERKAV